MYLFWHVVPCYMYLHDCSAVLFSKSVVLLQVDMVWYCNFCHASLDELLPDPGRERTAWTSFRYFEWQLHGEWWRQESKYWDMCVHRQCLESACLAREYQAGVPRTPPLTGEYWARVLPRTPDGQVYPQVPDTPPQGHQVPATPLSEPQGPMKHQHFG